MTTKVLSDEEKVKNRKDFDERFERWKKKTYEINERLKKKDYVLTVYQTGDESMSNGDWERQVSLRRFYVVCSLEEIPDYIKSMKTPFWTHDKGLSKKEIENYPYEEKKWGKYRNVIIEPLSEELEKSYLGASKKGFFKSWRRIHQSESDEVL